MQNFLHKSLALLLSASLLCAYAVPGYSAEAPTQTEYSNETFSGATEGYFDNDANLVIKNSTFSDNSSTIDDGAAINSNGTLNVEGSKFNNNTVNYDGGAGGALFLKGTNTIDKTDFEGNSVVGDYGGGALYLSNKSNSLTLTNSTFTNNTATNATSAEDAAGGAVALLKKADLEKVTFTGNKSVSTGNLGNGGGGAMFIGAEGKVKIEESSFTENNSNTDGGAIATRTEPPASNIDATLDIDETTFTGNIASGKGGAIYNSFYNSTETPGYASIEESTFTGNSAAIGGAIYNDQNGKISIEEGTFSNNTAATAGGAIYNLGTLTVTDNTTFTGNKVTADYYDGGAIYTKGDLNISQGVSFLNNEADFGGAIYVSGHNTTNIDGATFTGNKVESDTYPVAGGAIYHALTSGSTETKNTLNIKNSSFSNNSAISSVGAAGGALAIFAKADLDTVTFEQNQTNGEDGGGAIFLGSLSETTVKNSTFKANTGTVGGAISSRTEPPNDNSKATLDITGSTFTGNIATDKGGAIYNSFYNSNNAAGSAYIADSTFSGNSAAKAGGAIYNDATGKLTIAGNSVFSGNKVTADYYDGGAIYTKGDLNISQGVSFLNNEADFGGAIYVSGHNTTNIDGATFTGNKVESDTYPVAGGAIYHALTSGSTETKNTLNIKNSSFSNNSAISSVGAAGGALAIFAKADLDTVTFEQNQTNGEDGGGAIFLGSVSETAIKDATFSNNTATVGGAISSRTEPPNDNSKATLDITGSTFTGNIATDKGGAIYNSFYNSNNAAGAAYIADSTFSNNEAATEGGAIYNALNGHLTLAGTNTFRGNTAGGVANDIYNLGTLNIGGTASFEGGITGTGIVNVTDGATVNLGLGTIEADSISFANGSTLGVTLGNDAMGNLKANSITIGETTDDTANLIITVSTDFAAADSVTQQLTNTAIADGTGTFAMADVTNALYDVSFDNTNNIVTAVRKSQEEQTTAIENAGGNANNLATITAFTSSSDLGSEAANQMAQTINQLAQTDVQAAVQATTALAPEQAAAKQAVQTSAVNQLFSAINSRLNNAANGSVRTYAFGNNSYYADGTNYSVWAQGLLNKSHKEGTADASAFTGRSTGLAFGVDTQIAEDWTAGLGYAYLHTNVSSLDRHDRVLGDNFFLYGQYRPSNFFVQAALNYGDSKYEEDKNVAGSEVNADYHIKAYSANVTAGYDLNENVTPLVGLRYTNTQQESYKDSSDQRVSSEKDDYLTAVLGVQLQQESMLDNIKIRPALNLGLAYDLLSDNVSSRVSLPNGTAYDVSGERLHRLSFEAGLSVAALVSDNVEVSLSYDGSFRQDYNSNTGSLKLRYMF